MTVFLRRQQFEELVARKNISLEDLAKILGVTRPYLSMLKDPQKYNFSPSPDLREKMLKFFNCKFDDIFFIQSGRFIEHSSK